MATIRTSSPATGSQQAWWQRPWVLPLGFVVTVFLVYSLPPYLGLDPARSRVPPPAGLGWYYPLLVTHIGCASIAMLGSVLQVWPWFRGRYPVAHRRIGRVYVFAGVLPAGIAGLVVGSVSPFGPVAAVSNMTLAALWLLCTANGYRAARARSFGVHRRWMVRSFALTMSIITNRVWAVVWVIVLGPQLQTTFGGSELAMLQAIGGLTTWCGWVSTLLVAEWWLQRGNRRAGSAAAKPQLQRQ